MANLQQSMNLPKILAYGQVGYSYPGLNFLESQSDYYYIVGARLSWTLFDWKQNKREVQMIRAQKENITIREAVFDQQLTMARDREVINQNELMKMILLDKDIIRQREAVTRGSEVALKEGIITPTDYLEDLNMEMKARMDAESRMLELHHSYIKMKILEGIDLSDL